jgi:hypothetical protein
MLRGSPRAAKPAASCGAGPSYPPASSRAAITGMFPGATGLGQKPAMTWADSTIGLSGIGTSYGQNSCRSLCAIGRTACGQLQKRTFAPAPGSSARQERPAPLSSRAAGGVPAACGVRVRRPPAGRSGLFVVADGGVQRILMVAPAPDPRPGTSAGLAGARRGQPSVSPATFLLPRPPQASIRSSTRPRDQRQESAAGRVALGDGTLGDCSRGRCRLP